MTFFQKLYLTFGVIFGVVEAASLATIDPCPQRPGKADSVTITSQYQPASTCIPQVQNGATTYSYSTYAYISTIVPCMVDGPAMSSTLVSDTAQWITLKKYPEMTSTVMNAMNKKLVQEIVQKQGLARFDECGDLAFPGWAGSGLCEECSVVATDGSRRQKIHIQECRKQTGNRTCTEWDEYWYSRPAPPATAFVYPVCATRSVVSNAGTYVFTFPQPATTQIITVPEEGSSVTAIQAPWSEYITKTCGGPTVFDFTTTVTKTITVYIPWETGSPGGVVTVPNPPPTGFPWPPHHGGGNPNGPPNGPPNRPPPPTAGDQPTLTGTTSSMSTIGQFSTITINSGGPNAGTTPITITIGNPTDTDSGTVIVIEPTSMVSGSTSSTSDTSSSSPSSSTTGTFITVTVTPTDTSGDEPTLTATIASPSGTDPGTVIVVSPTDTNAISTPTSASTSQTSFASTSTTTSTTDQISDLLTSATASSSTDESGVGSTTSPCVGALCVGVSATLTGTGFSTTVIVLPTTDASGSTVGSTTLTAVLSPTTTPCVGALCIGVSASLSNIGIGATITVLPITDGNGNTLGSTTITLPAPSTTPCSGALCVEVSASLTNIGVGATITVLPVTDGSGNTVGSTTLTLPAASTTPCVGALCIGVSASLSDIGIGATVTILPVTDGNGNTVGSSTITLPASSGPPCSGALCVGVSASLTDIGIGATITVLPITNANGNTVGSSTVAITSPQTAIPCSGVLCIGATASLPVAGEVGAVITVLPLTDASGSTTGSATMTLITTLTTPCTGALCLGATAIASLVDVGVSAVVLPVTDGAGNIIGSSTESVIVPATTHCMGLACIGIAVSAPIATVGASATVLPVTNANGNTVASATVIAGSSSTTTPCVGALCVGASASPPLVTAGVSVTILPVTDGTGNTVGITSITLPIGGVTPTSTVPCVGVLCVQVSASAPIVTLGVGATVLPVTNGNGNTVDSTIIVLTPAPGPSPTNTPCVGALCVGVSVSAPIISAGVTVIAGISNGSPAPAVTTSQAAAVAATAATPCNGLLCVSASAGVPVVGTVAATVGVNTAVGVSVSASVLQGQSSAVVIGQATIAPVKTTLTTVVVQNQPAATTKCSGLLCVSASVSLRKRSFATPALEPVIVQYLSDSGYQRHISALCSTELNLCRGMDIDDLFEAQPCTPLVRVGCTLTNTLNSARHSCRDDGCAIFGVTSDGLLSLTSDLSIEDIQDRMHEYAQAQDGVCVTGQSVKIYVNSPHCRN